MEIIDANIVLRYLLKDHKSFYPKSKQIIEKNDVHILTEVMAEIVYVLEKVYKVPRNNISEALSELISYPNITVSDEPVCYESLKLYRIENIDFVDSIIASYSRLNGDLVYTFDKKLRKLCIEE